MAKTRRSPGKDSPHGSDTSPATQVRNAIENTWSADRGHRLLTSGGLHTARSRATMPSSVASGRDSDGRSTKFSTCLAEYRRGGGFVVTRPIGRYAKILRVSSVPTIAGRVEYGPVKLAVEARLRDRPMWSGVQRRLSASDRATSFTRGVTIPVPNQAYVLTVAYR